MNISGKEISEITNYFFVGVAGAGMSAIAQYLSGSGKQVSGSDRYFNTNVASDIRQLLEQAQINCFAQDGSGIDNQTELVVVSTAVEKSNVEYQKALDLGIRIVERSDLLAAISQTKKTIAIAGTSGKSTTVAMLFDVLLKTGVDASLISGAGLIELQKQQKLGNAYVGQSDWLIIEADESDGSLVKYKADIGVILNIDKDHKELEELEQIFTTFSDHTQNLIVNLSQARTAKYSRNKAHDFAYQQAKAGFSASQYTQDGFAIKFRVHETDFHIPVIGRFNMENALAAIAVASRIGLQLPQIAEALHSYQGIYRRQQLLGHKHGIAIIDDYAHNPVKLASVIRSCQAITSRVVVWFQPHGFAPTRFLRHEFVEEIHAAMRPSDRIIMSEIFYAGGTVAKDISANDLITDLQAKGTKAFFVENRNDLIAQLHGQLHSGDLLLLTGARDPSLEVFAKEVFEAL